MAGKLLAQAGIDAALSENLPDLVVAIPEELGYRVSAAETGRTTLELLSANSPCDLLPASVATFRLRGIDIMRSKRGIGRDSCVLDATGYADLAACRPGLEGEYMIRKPCRMADLAARVDRALHGPPDYGSPGD
ncbi:MAG TPA: hypothetical protein VND19_19910 [Acetobacteraceae bacterium]|nr:hypothetical protein [Acetobacteraceae bacterium]